MLNTYIKMEKTPLAIYIYRQRCLFSYIYFFYSVLKQEPILIHRKMQSSVKVFDVVTFLLHRNMLALTYLTHEI